MPQNTSLLTQALILNHDSNPILAASLQGPYISLNLCGNLLPLGLLAEP